MRSPSWNGCRRAGREQRFNRCNYETKPPSSLVSTERGASSFEQSQIFISILIGGRASESKGLGLRAIRIARSSTALDRRTLAIHPVKAGLKAGSAQRIAWDAQSFTNQIIHRSIRSI